MGSWAMDQKREALGMAGRARGALSALTLLQANPHCIWKGDLSHAGNLVWLLIWAEAALVASRTG